MRLFIFSSTEKCRNGERKKAAPLTNNLKFFTGQSDIELTDIGREQARLCGEFFKEYKGIDAIYSSDLSRAYDTAIEVGRALSLEVKKDAELREIFAGEWEMMPFVKIEEKYPAEYAVWKNDIGRANPTSGESVFSMATRVEGAIRRIAAEHDEGCVVIVTHATPIRAICTLSEGLDLSEMGRVSWVSNASISIFDFDGNFKLVEKNITSHLGSLKTDPTFASILTIFDNPIIGVIVGALLTAIVQSSSASIGILQALSVTGSISFGMAIPIVLGQNIGTCVTAMLSALGANKNGKRTAVVHLFFNVIGVVFWLSMYYLAGWILGSARIFDFFGFRITKQ